MKMMMLMMVHSICEEKMAQHNNNVQFSRPKMYHEISAMISAKRQPVSFDPKGILGHEVQAALHP
jgi:hypothetical protein